MDLEELRSVREQERRTDSLQHLRDSFYDDAADYVRELKRERTRRAEAAGDPYAADAMRLTDEIDTAEEVIESLYERRRGKVVKLASFAAAGMPAETDGMTDQERAMFDDVVARIEANEAAVLGALDDGDTDTGASTAGGAATADAGSVGDPVSTDAAASAGSAATDEEPTHVIGDPEGVDDGPQSTAEVAADEPVPTPGAGEAAAGAVSPGPGDGSVAPPAPDEQGAGGETPGDVTGTGAGADTGDGDGVLADAMGGDDTPGAGAAADTDTAATDTGTATTDTGTASTTADTATESGADASADATGASATRVETAADDGTPRPTAEAAAVSGGESDRPVAEAAAAAGPETATTSETQSVAGTSDTAESGTDDTSQSTETDAAQPGGTDETETVAVDRTTVRVTSDVGEIFGVDDRSYELRSGDVVTLPTTNVDPLVDRGAAERLD